MNQGRVIPRGKSTVAELVAALTGAAITLGALGCTTLGASGQISSTLATGTAPISVTSTTVCPNLNVSQLLGKTWAVPAAIGSTTPAAGSFTTLTASTSVVAGTSLGSIGTCSFTAVGAPDAGYGNFCVGDTTAFAAGVGGRFTLIGKYNTAGAWANFAEIQGRKANATDGSYSGKIALRAHAGTSPNMHDILVCDGATDLATFTGGVSCTTLTLTGKITSVSAVPASFADLAAVRTWLAAQFT